MKKYAIWLSGDLAPAQQLIDDLAVQNGTHTFPAHLTLAGGYDDSILEEWDALRTRIVDHLPLPLIFDKLDYSELYFQSIHLSLRESAKWNALRKIVKPIEKNRGNFSPHISLWYGVNGVDMKRKQINQDIVWPSQFVFDQIQLVSPETGRWEDTQHWRIIK